MAAYQRPTGHVSEPELFPNNSPVVELLRGDVFLDRQMQRSRLHDGNRISNLVYITLTTTSCSYFRLGLFVPKSIKRNILQLFRKVDNQTSDKQMTGCNVDGDHPTDGLALGSERQRIHGRSETTKAAWRFRTSICSFSCRSG